MHAACSQNDKEEIQTAAQRTGENSRVFQSCDFNVVEVVYKIQTNIAFL
jgi:hypothetical protein